MHASRAARLANNKLNLARLQAQAQSPQPFTCSTVALAAPTTWLCALHLHVACKLHDIDSSYDGCAKSQRMRCQLAFAGLPNRVLHARCCQITALPLLLPPLPTADCRQPCAASSSPSGTACSSSVPPCTCTRCPCHPPAQAHSPQLLTCRRICCTTAAAAALHTWLP